MNQAQSYLDGSPLDRNVFLLLLIGGFFVLASRSKLAGPLFHTIHPVLFFYLYCAISIFWSEYPFVSFKHWLKGIGDVVMVLIVLTDPDPPAALRRLLSRVGFILLPISVLYIKYFPNLGRIYTVGGASEFTGVTTQKNSLGLICLVFGLGSLWRFLAVYRDPSVTRRSYKLVAHGTIIAMALWLLHTCDSMTSLSCLLMGGVFLLLAYRPARFRKPLVIHLLVAGMVGFCLFALFFQSSGSLLQNMGRNATLTGRTAIWDAVLRVAGNPLIGTGYESFWVGDRLKMIWAMDDAAFLGLNEAHNGYLELYLNLGWIGVALMALVVVTGYWKVLARFRLDPHAGSLGLAFFVAELAYNFTEAGFRMMCPIWIFFLLALVGIPRSPAAENVIAPSSDFIPAFDGRGSQNRPRLQTTRRVKSDIFVRRYE